MKPIETNELLFVLSEQQKEAIDKLQHYDFYYHLARHDFLHTAFSKRAMTEFWIIYYYEEIPLINSENAMFFLLRHYLVESLMKNHRLLRLKKTTVGSTSQAMMAAAATLNIFLDFLREVQVTLPKKEIDFFWKHAKNKKRLFSNILHTEETYPQQLVHIETKMLKKLRQTIGENQEQFVEKMQDAIRLIDQVSLIEREIFEFK